MKSHNKSKGLLYILVGIGFLMLAFLIFQTSFSKDHYSSMPIYYIESLGANGEVQQSIEFNSMAFVDLEVPSPKKIISKEVIQRLSEKENVIDASFINPDQVVLILTNNSSETTSVYRLDLQSKKLFPLLVGREADILLIDISPDGKYFTLRNRKNFEEPVYMIFGNYKINPLMISEESEIGKLVEDGYYLYTNEEGEITRKLIQPLDY